MNIGRLKICFIILSSILLCAQKSYPQEDRDLYYEGFSAGRRGEIDFAFMQYSALLENYPKSKFCESALFAVGEYYFSISDYYDAGRAFYRFINHYPQAKARPFGLIYLVKIARVEGKEELAKEFEKAIIRFKQSSFLFRDFKEYKYSSGFSKKYKAVYFIDKIEIYINNELFAKILL